MLGTRGGSRVKLNRGSRRGPKKERRWRGEIPDEDYRSKISQQERKERGNPILRVPLKQSYTWYKRKDDPLPCRKRQIEKKRTPVRKFGIKRIQPVEGETGGNPLITRGGTWQLNFEKVRNQWGTSILRPFRSSGGRLWRLHHYQGWGGPWGFRSRELLQNLLPEGG